MGKKRHLTFVKFITEEHKTFKLGEIGVIVKPHRSLAVALDNNQGKQEWRGGKISSLDGRKEDTAWEEIDYVRIKTTPALEVLYGKYHKEQTEGN